MDTAPLTDRARAVEVLAAAFHDDPVAAWVTPDPQERAAGLPRWFGLMVDAFAAHGCSWAAADGAALWSPPGQPLLTPEQEQAVAARLGDVGDPQRGVTLLLAMEEQRPTAPHHYLGYMGVLPSRQGQGLGAALLAPALARCDAAGEPAYLEASSRGSARLYARHGFVETGEIPLPDGPSLWTMWREPSAR